MPHQTILHLKWVVDFKIIQIYLYTPIIVIFVYALSPPVAIILLHGAPPEGKPTVVKVVTKCFGICPPDQYGGLFDKGLILL
jgi:hypothetical protein